ncbi:hypothetical protein BG011_000350 [Mortierella polycephala]|uniref:Cyclin N-terminal domain-containing protein n=1 Tax=Mortierella polycephala TaxID=41804 RepID=A0A9P6Q985_9FUNG|nr:hypothetical protein BG011_000350 [Mortierella polycephala]
MNGIVRVDAHPAMAMKKKSATAHSSPTKSHHISRAIKSTLNNAPVNAPPAAPTLVSNAMTSTIGWAKDETDSLLELEYKEEIFQYMKQMEKETMAVPEHMDLQPELTWDLRPLLVDFLIEIHSHFNLQPETLYLAMNMMDRYLSKRVVYKKHFQLVGMTSLWISSKYEDAKEKLPSVSQLCKLCSNAYDEAAFITMERHILKTLEYNLGHPTAEAFLKKDLEMSGQNNQVLRHVAQFLMELTIFQRCFLSFGSSTIAASALFLARSICRKQIVIPSDPNVFACIQYLDNSLTNVPKIVHEKYALPRLSRASIVVKEWVDNGGRALVQPISTTECSNPPWTLSNMLWQPPSPIPTTFPTQANTGNPKETQVSTYSHSSYATQHAHAQPQQQQQPAPPQKQLHRSTQKQPSRQTHSGRHHSQSVSSIVTQYVASPQRHRTGSSVSAHHMPYSTLPQQPQPAAITHQTTYDLRPIGSDCGARWVDISVDM